MKQAETALCRHTRAAEHCTQKNRVPVFASLLFENPFSTGKSSAVGERRSSRWMHQLIPSGDGIERIAMKGENPSPGT